MLVDAQLLTQEQLDKSLEAYRGSSGQLKFGQFLASQGVVKEGQVVKVLSVQLKIERYVPDRYPIDESLSVLLPAEISQRHQVVPLQKQNRLLVVGMLDPTDIQALDTIEQTTHCEVEPVICTERELNQLVSSIYGTSLGLGSIMHEMDGVEYGDGAAPAAGSEDVEVRSLMDLAEGAPAVRMVNWIIAEAVREGASDIHVSPERNYVQIRFRVDGRLREVPAPPKSLLLSIISRIKILAHMDIAVSRIPQDGRFTTRIEGKEINIRASTIPTINGENIVLRLLDMSATTYTLDNLGMSADDRRKIESLISRPYGMILSTGPTGSGKSTSLYAILRELNQPDINIITVEDPVEYRVDKIRQVQLNARAGMTFASGLRSILRQDPDVIMVGEIRDPETASIAVQAALTGHRVLSTAHTNDAAGAITRLVDMAVEPFLVASVLMVSFAQRLMRRVCTNCRTVYQPSREALGFWGLADAAEAEYMKASGCHVCMNTGYQGRVGIFEVLVVDQRVQEMIGNQAPVAEIVRVCREAGALRTLKEDASEKIRLGITTIEEAMSTVVV